MSNHHLLFSSLFSLLPLSYFYFKKDKNNYEYVLAALLLINLILSIMFWSNPKKNGLIHKIDAFFARISILFFVIYVIFFKEIIFHKVCFLILSSITVFMFYNSNKESSKGWCCQTHTNSHMFFHLFAFLGATIAFI